MPLPISIATQNVGGMRGEFQKRHGPKFGILKHLSPRNLSFCVLTEVKCDPGNVKKSRLSNNLKPLLSSIAPQARGGVIVYSHPDYELIQHLATLQWVSTSRQPIRN
jgi:hypothetical protein